MENYADYKFYSEEYQGNLSNDLFKTLVIKASRDIDRNVNCRLTAEVINSLDEVEKYKLQYSTCELVDYMYNFGDNTRTNIVKSLSIDGVSINKGSNTYDAKKSKKAIYDNLPLKLTRWL